MLLLCKRDFDHDAWHIDDLVQHTNALEFQKSYVKPSV